MKKKLKIIILIVVAVILILSALGWGFEYYMNNIYEGSKSYITLSSGFTDVLVTDENSAIEVIKDAADELGITDDKNDLSVVSSSETDSGKTYKIQQYYDGYPVYEATAVLCVDTNGNATELTSHFKEIKKYSSTKSTLSSDDVREKLVNDWELDDSENTKTQGIPSPKSASWLSIDPTIYVYKCENGKFILAYIANYFGDTVIVRTDGKIIEYIDNAVSDLSVKCYNSNSSREFNGYYYTDNNYYKAYDSERNITIWTLQKKYNSKDKFKTAEELISDDEYFGNTENEKKQEYDTAVVFMNNISKIYDYYNDTFSETAYGNLLLCYNYAKDNGNNGYAEELYDKINGNLLGGGLFIGYNKDANDIDLLAHEYTHLVTSSKINWADSAEQWEKEEDYEGALKEAYSDIFGEIIACKISGEDPDWIHGDRIIYDPMSNNYPANINDKEWKLNLLQWVANGFKQGYGMDVGGLNTTDYAHGFSTVISHSAYLMWNGIDGDKSKKIDIDTLAEIWYNSLNILSENQDNKDNNLTAVTFVDCANAVLRAAKELLKNGSITEEQYNCVVEAFNKVGILNENDLSSDDNTTNENIDYEKIYTDYINNTIVADIGVCKSFEKTLSDISESDIYKNIDNSKGLSSVYIEDFNNDNIPEMITVSVLGQENSAIKIQVHLYCIENNKVIDKGIVYETEKYDNADEQLYIYSITNDNTKYLCLSDNFWYGNAGSSNFGQYFKAFSFDKKNSLSTIADITFSYNRGNVTYKINDKDYIIAKDGQYTNNKSSAEKKLNELFSNIGLSEFSGVDVESSYWMGFPKKIDTKIFECGTEYKDSNLSYVTVKVYLTDYTEFSDKYQNETTTKETTTAKKETTAKENLTAKITNDDISVFEDMIEKTSWIWCSGEKFDFEGASAQDILNTSWIFSNACGPELYEYFFDDVKTIENDPKGKFEWGYKLSADNFDWIIKNIFEVEPDRNAETDLIYYKDNYCYCSHVDGGGGFDVSVKTDSVYDLGDELYGIVLNATYTSDVNTSWTTKRYYVTKLNRDNEHGKYWSLIKYAENEKIFDTTNKIL